MQEARAAVLQARLVQDDGALECYTRESRIAVMLPEEKNGMVPDEC
jgi:hypothetical protein